MATGTIMDILLSPSQPNGPEALFVAEKIDNDTVNNADNTTNYTDLTNVPLLPSEVTNACNFENSFNDFYLSESYANYNDDETIDSQPKCNQEYYTILDEILCNLPKVLYINKLVQLCHDNDDDVRLYRSIIHKRAQEIPNCPSGTLIHRRTTENERSCTKYARDCYLLQQFINNRDPKYLTDVFTKPKLQQKSKNSVIYENNQSAALQAEMANVLSKTNLLSHSVDELNKSRTSDHEVINKLTNDLKEIKVYYANLVESTNRTLNYHMQLIQNLLMEVLTLKKNQTFIDNTVSQRALPNATIATLKCTSTLPSNTETSPQEPCKSLSNPVSLSNDTSISNKQDNLGSLSNKDTICTATDTLKCASTLFPNTTKPNQEHDKPQTKPEIIAKDKPISQTQEQSRPMTYAEALNSEKSITQVSRNIPVRVTNAAQSKPATRTFTQNRRPPNHHTRSNTEYERPLTKQTLRDDHTYTNEEPVFKSVPTGRTRRYYIGGISKLSNRAGTSKFFTDRGIEPATIRLIETKRGTLAAKIAFYEQDWETIENKAFWPRKMYCRRWYGEREWESLFYCPANDDVNEYPEID